MWNDTKKHLLTGVNTHKYYSDNLFRQDVYWNVFTGRAIHQKKGDGGIKKWKKGSDPFNLLVCLVYLKNRDKANLWMILICHRPLFGTFNFIFLAK